MTTPIMSSADAEAVRKSYGLPAQLSGEQTPGERKLTMDKHPVWTIAFGVIMAHVVMAVVGGIIAVLVIIIAAAAGS